MTSVVEVFSFLDRRILGGLLRLLINLYRWTLGICFRGSCRFEPTCSRYAEHAIEKYGGAKGLWMSLRRLLRCQPFHPGGFDPVP